MTTNNVPSPKILRMCHFILLPCLSSQPNLLNHQHESQYHHHQSAASSTTTSDPLMGWQTLSVSLATLVYTTYGICLHVSKFLLWSAGTATFLLWKRVMYFDMQELWTLDHPSIGKICCYSNCLQKFIPFLHIICLTYVTGGMHATVVLC